VPTIPTSSRPSRCFSSSARSATFGRARGPEAYEEASVDAFFSRAVEVLLGVE
jgi:hypothetical protein